MKKFVRVAGIIFAVFILLLVILGVVAKVLITPERIRAAVLPMASEALHRQVELGEVEISLFRGITLHELKVLETDGKESFVSADEVVLRYQLLPLLFKQVVIDEVRLVAPRIRLVRLADGRFSFSDLLPSGENAPDSSTAESPSPSGGASIDLLVSEVSIRNGLLVFDDHVINPSAPLEYKLENLDFSAKDISLQKDFPFALKVFVNGSPLEIVGSINTANRQGQAKVLLDDLDVTVFSPYFASKLPGKLGSLKLKLDLQIDGNPEAVASSGRLEMKQIDLVLDDLKEAPLRDFRASLEHRVKVDLAGRKVSLEEANLDVNGILLKAAGAIENYDAAPAVDIQLSVPDLNLRTALAAIPPNLVQGVNGMDPAGIINISAHLAGPVDKGRELLREAEIRLEGLQANAGGMRPAISGVLSLQGDALVSRGLNLTAGDNKAGIELQAKNLYGRPINITNRITSDRFNLDALLQTAAAPAAGGAAQQAPSTPSGTPEEVGPFDLPLRIDGGMKVGQTFYKGLVIENFELHYLLDKNVLTVDRLNGKVAEGTLDQTARVDLSQKGLEYATRLALRDVKAESVVNAMVPKASGTVFGALSLNANLNGRGTLPENLKRNLSGNGDFRVVDGKLTGAGLIKGLADFVNLDELRTIDFKEAKGSFTITNGRVNLNSNFSGSNIRFAPQGTVGLDGALDIGLDLRLSPALSAKLDKKGGVSQYLTDAEGWSQLPLKASGTIGSPRFALDASAVKGKLQEKAREEIEKKLQEKVFDKLAPQEGSGGSQEPSKQMIEEGLKKLLGR